MSRLRSLIREVHRRSLWQVLGIYGVGAWVVLQVVDVIGGNVGLPEWTFPFALVLLLLGLPVVLATAFVQEGVGSRPEPGAGAAEITTTRDGLFTWRNAMVGGIGAFALWGVVAAGWMLAGGRPVTGGDGEDTFRSIAVLPFVARSDGAGEEADFFAAGMHDDLLTQLAKIDSLTVISRTSVMKYADTQQSIPEIAAELGVAVILEGGVQRSGNRVRVNAQLIEAATDKHLWADTYDEELTAANVFAIQSDLARKIAEALHATLSPATARRIDKRPTESLAAYDLYNRARSISDRRGRTRDGVESAMALLEEALAIDPEFAPARVALANSWMALAGLGYRPSAEALPIARAATERALALDPELSEAHATLALLIAAEGRFEEAERAAARALELNPGSSDAHRSYGNILFQLNRLDEAVESARRSLEMDPLSISARLQLLARLSFAERTGEALDEARRILEMDPDHADAHYYAAIAHYLAGNHGEGIAMGKRALELNPEDPYYPAGVAYGYALAGQRDSAEAYIRIAEAAGAPIKEIALVRGVLGDLDEAFTLLDRAAETDAASVRALSRDPTAKPLRSDPRWAALMQRVGGTQ